MDRGINKLLGGEMGVHQFAVLQQLSFPNGKLAFPLYLIKRKQEAEMKQAEDDI